MKHTVYTWRDGKKLVLIPGHASIMGILNVTPDSFSDGGTWNTENASVKHTLDMIHDGAEIIDIGAESTRPGGTALSPEDEWDRLSNFLPGILHVTTVPISVDTYHWQVARKAMAAGAHMMNDIWGFQYDDGEMAEVAAEFGVPVIIMHNQEDTNYKGDIIECMKAFFDKSIDIGLKKGVREENIILDPGIGFGKDGKQNIEVLKRLGELTGTFELPWLLGVSRKRFIGAVLGTEAKDRDEGTAAVTIWGIEKGCAIHRVHNVRMVKRMCTMWEALE